jgi:hypothetical protein
MSNLKIEVNDQEVYEAVLNIDEVYDENESDIEERKTEPEEKQQATVSDVKVKVSPLSGTFGKAVLFLDSKKWSTDKNVCIGIISVMLYVAWTVIAFKISYESISTTYSSNCEIASYIRVNVANIDGLCKFKEEKMFVSNPLYTGCQPTNFLMDSQTVLGYYVARNNTKYYISRESGVLDPNAKYFELQDVAITINYNPAIKNTVSAGIGHTEEFEECGVAKLSTASIYVDGVQPPGTIIKYSRFYDCSGVAKLFICKNQLQDVLNGWFAGFGFIGMVVWIVVVWVNDEHKYFMRKVKEKFVEEGSEV